MNEGLTQLFFSYPICAITLIIFRANKIAKEDCS
jgi:hypothetical protein